MSRRLKVAVRLHAGADGTAADAPEHARHAEQLGLDGIFVGDHLKPAGAYPESMVVLAAVAASTERIHVGVGVMVLALRALRRAARHWAGWCPRYGHAPADRRRRPQRPDNAQIAVGGMALLEADVTDPRIDQLVSSLADGHGIPPEDAVDLPITGTPAQAAERFAAYADAGATWLVLGTIGDDWHAQWELITEASTLLD